MGRTNKGIRFDDDALALADALLEYLPEHQTQADLLHQAALIGLQVLAARAPEDAALPRFAGRALPEGLPPLLWQTLAYAVDYMAEHGALPRRYLGGAAPSSSAAAVLPPPAGDGTEDVAAAPPADHDLTPADMRQEVDGEVADFLDDMGSNLL